jgi:hypothetical protein
MRWSFAYLTGPTIGQVASVMEPLLLAFFRAGQALASWTLAEATSEWSWMIESPWCETLAFVIGHLASGLLAS